MLGVAHEGALRACTVFYTIMEIKAATTFEKRISYIFEIQKRYRKEIFLQCKKRHCLVVRKFFGGGGFVFSP